MKRLKAILSLTLILSTTSCFLPTTVLADSPVPNRSNLEAKEEETYVNAAKKYLKDYFDLTIDSSYNVSTSKETYLDNPSVFIEFTKEKGDLLIYNSITLDYKTLEALSIYTEGGNYEGKPSISYEAGKSVAKDFLNKYFAKYKDKTIFDSSYEPYASTESPYEYYIFLMNSNGVPYEGNSISIGVDKVDKKVKSFSIYWNDKVSLPDAKASLSKEDAAKIYEKSLGTQLEYINDPQNPDLIKLAYTPLFPVTDLIDATNGSPINYHGDSSVSIFKPDDKKTKAILDKKSTPLKLVSSNKEDAEKECVKIMEDFYSGKFAIKMSELDQDSNLMIDMERTDKKDNKTYSIYVNLKKSEISSITRYLFDTDTPVPTQKSISFEDAYYKALDAAHKYYPKETAEVSLIQEIYPGANDGISYNFTFHRLVNGIKYLGNSINISIDGNTGETEYLGSYWDKNLSFPSSKASISKEDAFKKIFKDVKMELKYVDTFSKNSSTPRPKLVYKPVFTPSFSSFIDANTGQVIEQNKVY